jgi:hypothetical protein
LSNINIEVVDVVIENKGKYDKMSVTHKTTDYQGKLKVDAKALMSFATPIPVWEAFKAAAKGEVYTIERQKTDDGKYWNWVAVHRQDGDVVSSNPVSPAPAGKATFTERDDVRQRLIVRQSSLAQAVAFDTGAELEAVLETAEKFCNWVFETEKA